MINLSTSAHNTLVTQSIYHQTGRDHMDQIQKSVNEHDFDSELQKILKKEQNLQNKDLAFWNGLADGRLESIAGILNLFIFMLMLSLASKAYNGPDTNGTVVLGWISIAQVCFAYFSVIIVKFCYLPKLEEMVNRNKSQGFIILSDVHKRKKQLTNLTLEELQILLELFEERAAQVRPLISKKEAQSLINETHQILNSHSHHQYQYNLQLKVLKDREKNAKYWQNFWQVFILNKTYSIPGSAYLLLILILVSITADSGQNIVAQGWIAIGISSGAITVYIFIKLILWDHLNEKVSNAKSEPLIAFNSVYFKFSELKSLSLKELEQLQEILRKRTQQFDICFPNVNSKQVLQNVRLLISQKLPKKKTQAEMEKIKQIVRKQRTLQNSYATWLNFFNTKAVSVIINILKFLIVIALSFIETYAQTAENIRNAQITIGSLGIANLVLGQLFYWYLRFFGLQKMKKQVKQANSKPFVTFSLVYFGNKQLDALKPHQVQDINQALLSRREQFVNCFPNLYPEAISSEIKKKLRQNSEIQPHNSHLSNLLKRQLQAKETLSFWTGYCDGPLLSSVYSIYVLIVLLMVSMVEGKTGVITALGWLGVAVIGFLVVIVLWFKCFFLQELALNAKVLKVPGISEFHLVYTKEKQLKSVEPQQLQWILKIIKSNPEDFEGCFPNTNLQHTRNEVEQLLKESQKALQSEELYLDIKVQLQVNRQELSKTKNLLASWTSIIKERLYVLMPIAIVLYIVWAQTIATTLYGVTVCGYLTVAFVSVAVFCILFYSVWYKQHLQAAIKKIQSNIRMLQAELHH